jgi:urease accessory protein
MTPTIVHGPWPAPCVDGRRVELAADRQTLAKRRWQGTAEDGAVFGFDLHDPLADGTVFQETEAAHYVLRQKPEAVLEIALGEKRSAAETAWSLGNLHFQIELDHDVLRVADDPAIRLYFERAGIGFSLVSRVFRPLRAVAHSHGHHHH